MYDSIQFQEGFVQGYAGQPLYPNFAHAEFIAGWEHGNEIREEEDTALFRSRETSGFNQPDEFFSPER